jgi:hypothetical protein
MNQNINLVFTRLSMPLGRNSCRWLTQLVLLMVAMSAQNVLAQTCPDLGGIWTVTESVTLTATVTYTPTGESETDTETETGIGTVEMTQVGCTVRFFISAPGPDGTVQLERVGTIEGDTVTFTGIAAVPTTGTTCSKNSFVAVGTIDGNRIDVTTTVDIACTVPDFVLTITGDGTAVFSRIEIPPVQMNAGLNDAWYNPETDGQGFFITVFPDLGAVSLAWFTYDTELPAEDATANLGDPGHRWFTAVGPIEGNQAIMQIELTSGGIFDAASIIERTDPPGSDGTIILTFDSCNSGTIEYDIPSINRQGLIPIQRVADDNVVICEALSTD